MTPHPACPDLIKNYVIAALDAADITDRQYASLMIRIADEAIRRAQMKLDIVPKEPIHDPKYAPAQSAESA